MAYLLGPKHHGHHALRLRGLGALVDEDGAELHLSQPRVPSTNTRAADHIRILGDTRERSVATTYPMES